MVANCMAQDPLATLMIRSRIVHDPQARRLQVQSDIPNMDQVSSLKRGPRARAIGRLFPLNRCWTAA